MSGKRPITEVEVDDSEAKRQKKDKPAVSPIPDGYYSVTPFLVVSNGKEALDYYDKAFGAKELMKFEGPNGSIMHAEVQLGNSRIMVCEEYPPHKSPTTLGGTTVGLCIYVEDVDTVFKRAIEMGGKETAAIKDQFYGDRSGTLIDPYGHSWTVATHIEDVSVEEMHKCGEEFMKKHFEKKWSFSQD